ncbi:class I SAM-dependent methyltransferase [Leptolyngbya sp. PCC 6406]|uniref:class I SAM-dependent methyltransferase n=1 Tax=Leptolyngbya sp. PCC 6406 TaxID=1173264 RepID=UPI0021F20ADE|nr:class I SAM-dependent methyltransferase [Leptolyngbya sp. PCC 6406]
MLKSFRTFVLEGIPSYLRQMGLLSAIALSLSLMACGDLALRMDDGSYQYREPSVDGIGKIYMGREISQIMGHQGAYWLERPSRELAERPQAVVDALDLTPDAVVADVGTGTGYMAVRLAAAVPQGQVLAVDVQPEMVTLLHERLATAGIENIKPVQGAVDDPHLPTAAVDLALMVDAYHEFAFPREMMTHLVTALKPGGQVVLAEYRAENPLVMIKRLHKMSEAQVRYEMRAVGLRWVKTDESLPQQHLLFFEKPLG